MQPHPTDHPGLIRVPGPSLTAISLRFAALSNRDQFDPAWWPQHPLANSPAFPGWWEIDIDLLALADGDYEYEFVVNGGAVVADPYADRITRFGGYRGVFKISNSKRIPEPFGWDGEVPPGTNLLGNTQITIHEMPIKWMASDPGENAALVELGTFDSSNR